MFLKLKTVPQMSVELEEPASVIRHWVKRHNVPFQQKSRMHYKYFGVAGQTKLHRIKKLYREDLYSAIGVDKQLTKKGYENVKDVRKSKTVLPTESKRSSLRSQESTGNQRVKEEGTDDYEDVSEVFENYWDQYIT
tara:strand:- start:2402 stop:2809 length:408 start_codon:yes stop_codon:yes gene_type:complete